MPSYSSNEVLKKLNDDGWIIKNSRGSHVHLYHPQKKGKVTIPHPKKDLDVKTYNSILKQAGIK